jgi:hypothetical protein
MSNKLIGDFVNLHLEARGDLSILISPYDDVDEENKYQAVMNLSSTRSKHKLTPKTTGELVDIRILQIREENKKLMGDPDQHIAKKTNFLN